MVRRNLRTGVESPLLLTPGPSPSSGEGRNNTALDDGIEGCEFVDQLCLLVVTSLLNAIGFVDAVDGILGGFLDAGVFIHRSVRQKSKHILAG